MLLIKLLGPIVVLLVALINVALQAKWRRLHDGRTEVHRQVVRGLIALLILATITTCAVVWNDDRMARTLATEVRLKTQRIIGLAETNAVLGVRIADLADRNSRFLSGGDNYCYFDLVESYDPTNRIAWYIIHTGSGGNFPVYQVRGYIQDLGKANDLKTKNHTMTDREIRETSTTHFDLGDVNPEDWRTYQRLDMGARTDQAYLIDFYARNGRWQQMSVLVRTNRNARWLLASKVRPFSHGSPAMAHPYSSMSQGFPTNWLPKGWDGW